MGIWKQKYLQTHSCHVLVRHIWSFLTLFISLFCPSSSVAPLSALWWLPPTVWSEWPIWLHEAVHWSDFMCAGLFKPVSCRSVHISRSRGKPQPPAGLRFICVYLGRSHFGIKDKYLCRQKFGRVASNAGQVLLWSCGLRGRGVG